MLTRKRSLFSDTGGTQEDECDQRRCCHVGMVKVMRLEIVSLKERLEREEKLRKACCRSDPATRCGRAAAAEEPSSPKAHRLRLAYELDACKRELAEAQRSLEAALHDNERAAVELANKTSEVTELKERLGLDELPAIPSHPRPEWIGRHYLAVSLPEEYMFRPGESVTAVGVMQKLFEMRLGEKQDSSSFSILLEYINTLMAQREPEWYARHFRFAEAKRTSNGYPSTSKVDTEHFAWLIFEYRAQAAFVLAMEGMLKVLGGMGRGGVTNMSLKMSREAYVEFAAVFKAGVLEEAQQFSAVYAKALAVKESTSAVVPVNAGLLGYRDTERGGEDYRRDFRRAKSKVLVSVLEGIEAPRFATPPGPPGRPPRPDPFNITGSLAEFVKGRRPEGDRTGERGHGESSRETRSPPSLADRRLADRVRYVLNDEPAGSRP